MLIAAFYIHPNTLPHVFGINHNGITINLGGRNLYKVINGEIAEILPNPYFMEDLINDSINLFSCFVGNNGGGKTSVLKLLTSDQIGYYIIEMLDGSYKVFNTLEIFHRIYYTPYLSNELFSSIGKNGKDLSKMNLFKIDNHGDSGLLDDFFDSHNSENVKRWIRFNNFFRKQGGLDVNLPVFSKIKIRLRHFDFSGHNLNSFHDTSYQLRNVLILIMNKINIERIEEEKILGSQYDSSDSKNDKHFCLVKFKFALYEVALGKLVNILERRGNRYLSEGFVPGDYEEQIFNLRVRESFIWFLSNCGVYFNDDYYYFKDHLILIELVEYIISISSISRIEKNWLEVYIDEDEALKIIDLYDDFNNGFNNDWFVFDNKPMFSFFPDISISSGEQSFLDLFSTLYFHAYNMSSRIELDTYSYESLQYLEDKLLILLDEGDNAFHPRWKKAYIKHLRVLLPKIFKEYKLQVIITSHDPLTLSDLPRNCVIFLEKENGVTRLMNSGSSRTFGANIADLLKDSFFIGNVQIGDFAAGLIDKVITDINNSELTIQRVEEIKRIIFIIDEPIVKFKLAQMLGNSIGDKMIELNLIDQEIQRLQKRKEEL